MYRRNRTSRLLGCFDHAVEVGDVLSFVCQLFNRHSHSLAASFAMGAVQVVFCLGHPFKVFGSVVVMVFVDVVHGRLVVGVRHECFSDKPMHVERLTQSFAVHYLAKTDLQSVSILQLLRHDATFLNSDTFAMPIVHGNSTLQRANTAIRGHLIDALVTFNRFPNLVHSLILNCSSKNCL